MEYKKSKVVQQKSNNYNEVGKEALQLKDNRSNIVQRVEEPEELKGSMFKQFVGGFVTATANMFGAPTEKLFPLAQQYKEQLPEGRQELQDIVEPFRTGEDTQTAKMAEMITGQNGAQSFLNQPVGPEANQAFLQQLEAMKLAEGEPMSKQYEIESSEHVNLMKAFGRDLWNNPRSGLGSGMMLHGVGALYSKGMSGMHSVGEDPMKQQRLKNFLKYQALDDTNFMGGAGDFDFLDDLDNSKI